MNLKGVLENKHWLVKAISWVSITLVLTLFSMFIWSLIPGRGSVENLKWLQFLQTSATFLFPPLCLAYLCSTSPMRWIGLSRGDSASGPDQKQTALPVFLAVITMLVAIPGINLLSYINQQMTLPSFLEPLEALMKQQEEAALALTESFLKTNTFMGLLVNLALMAVLPAFAEEMTFRGMLVSPFLASAHHRSLAIWVSAILFSAVHFQFYGFVPRMLLGALFGYTLLWSTTLYLPILMHFVNNACAVLLYYFAYARGINPDDLDAIGTKDTLWLGILSLVLSVGTIYALRRSCTIKSASSRISSGS